MNEKRAAYQCEGVWQTLTNCWETRPDQRASGGLCETVVGENLERILRRCSRVGSVPGEFVRMVRKSVDVELYCLAVDAGLQKNSAKPIV